MAAAALRDPPQGGVSFLDVAVRFSGKDGGSLMGSETPVPRCDAEELCTCILTGETVPRFPLPSGIGSVSCLAPFLVPAVLNPHGEGLEVSCLAVRLMDAPWFPFP
ncbi:hypothetical protein Cadr_000012372 [Camelus dromedarius]|uniref:Uncharacterized protein n=1 Tax=Camelus dromedarius TaxID=9838 RepID=A0A5N4DV99_CAMDR|nr:hypothetical protein Cadr_000012372 [Camelus dromedarius]